MIITKSEIVKFRGFKNAELELGTQLTIIAGQNGTQKTTILGILTQPFTISDATNPMKAEKPLIGGSYKSAFSDKFKLSDNFDKPKEHEWTLSMSGGLPPFTVVSMKRQTGKGIRFWQKGSREAGSGYIQRPVLYLSLQRLMPIGEDSKLRKSNAVVLSAEESKFFRDWHKKILISTDTIQNTDYLESPTKRTIGINTNYYDSLQNSAGQDNIGRVLLAIMSFKRLAEKYPKAYNGGILAIDELDATLYPGSQIYLVDALRSFAAKYKIQIIFTTHSLTILEKVCAMQENNNKLPAMKDQVKVVFLEKRNSDVYINQNISFATIQHKLNVTVQKDVKQPKVLAFAEDNEAIIFVKALLKKRANKLKFVDATFSGGQLVDLARQKVPSFLSPASIIFLDGDTRENKEYMKQIKNFPNFIVLPTKISPERVLAYFLNSLDDNSPLWKKLNTSGTYTKQYCFKDISLEQITATSSRIKAKEWFKAQIEHWGKNGQKVIDAWAVENKEEAAEFISTFSKTYNTFADKLGLDKI